jgi:putative FmdB family regulatory protein
MPIYAYRCEKCGTRFEKIFLSTEEPERKITVCPKCNAAAKRDYSNHRFYTPGNPYSKELSEDSEEYREMHYYEKKKDWEKAAKAAEGISEYAKNKFLQKAQEKSSQP